MADLQSAKRAELKRRRAREGDHATCPACLMTTLVDPRAYPGRLTEHRPLPTAEVCEASGWWRCYACLDGDDAESCPHCAGAGWAPPVSGVVARANGGHAIVSDAPLRPGDVLAPGVDGASPS